MFALIALPFKLAVLLLTTLIGLLRGLLGLAAFLLNPFILIFVIILAGATFINYR